MDNHHSKSRGCSAESGVNLSSQNRLVKSLNPARNVGSGIGVSLAKRLNTPDIMVFCELGFAVGGAKPKTWHPSDARTGLRSFESG